MRILFVAWNPAFVLRMYGSTIRLLARRGHSVHLGFTNAQRDALYDALEPTLGQLARECPGVTYGRLPGREDRWARLADQVRSYRSLLFYQHPRFTAARKLLDRAADELGPLLRKFRNVPRWTGRPG